MANTFEYAQIFQTALDEQMIQGAVTGAMEMNASMVKYTGGNTIRVPKITLDGLKDYSRANGFGSAGSSTLEFETHTFDKDRAQTFNLDAMDVDETNFVATAGNMMGEFQRTQVIPEIDAYRFSKIYNLANAVGKVGSYTPQSSDIFDALLSDISTVQDKVGEGEQLTIYMSYPTAVVMDQADNIEKRLDVMDFARGTVNTKVRGLDGIPIIRVPSLRLKNAYTFGAGSFSSVAGALDLNWIITANRSVIAITKTDKMRIFDPSTNQSADAWKMDYRKYHTLIIPDNKMEGVYISMTPATAVVSPAFTLLTANNTTTITLTGGKFKTGVAITDLTFAGTDATALGAGTLVRTSDTVVTITHGTTLVGTDNVVTVKGSAQELQASSVLAAASTVS